MYSKGELTSLTAVITLSRSAAMHLLCVAFPLVSSGDLFITFLSGDVHKPGPVQFPCGTCKWNVNKNHMGDACDFWYHIGCVGISRSEYYVFPVLIIVGLCPVCLFSELPDSEFFHWILIKKVIYHSSLGEMYWTFWACDSIRLIHHTEYHRVCFQRSQRLSMALSTALCSSETWLRDVSLMPTFSFISLCSQGLFLRLRFYQGHHCLFPQIFYQQQR